MRIHKQHPVVLPLNSNNQSERKTKDEPQAGRRRLDRVVLVFIAHIRANVWCLFHFGHCIFTCKTKARGHWPQTDSIEVGTGSILNGTWKTVKVFYQNPTALTVPNETAKKG